MDHNLMKINVDPEALCLIRANPASHHTCDVAAIDEVARFLPKNPTMGMITQFISHPALAG